MKYLRLAIDLDGVVANFNAGWVRFYNRDFDADLTVDLVDDWDVIPRITHFASMGQFWDWAADLDGSSLFRHLDTFPDAVPALEDLDRMGHHIAIVTTKPDFAVHDTLCWLGERRIPTTEVHITDDKPAVEADVYLDDAPHQLRRIRRNRPEAVVVRFVRPWNAPLDGVEDIHTWDEFVELVGHLSAHD